MTWHIFISEPHLDWWCWKRADFSIFNINHNTCHVIKPRPFDGLGGYPFREKTTVCAFLGWGWLRVCPTDSITGAAALTWLITISQILPVYSRFDRCIQHFLSPCITLFLLLSSFLSSFLIFSSSRLKVQSLYLEKASKEKTCKTWLRWLYSVEPLRYLWLIQQYVISLPSATHQNTSFRHSANATLQLTETSFVCKLSWP